MKVKDANNPNYGLDDFPIHLKFGKVINDDIRDYGIIIYEPVGTGFFVKLHLFLFYFLYFLIIPFFILF